MKSSQLRPNLRIPYSDVVHRLGKLAWGKVERLGAISNYPFFVWRNSVAQSCGDVFLSAGIHGDEPAGVECLLRLLEAQPSWMKQHNIVVFPCLNPWGYERNSRVNAQGKDVNRQWRLSESEEVRLVLKALGKQRFDLAICLHEDYDADGFYLYELVCSGSMFGPALVKVASRVLPIDSRSSIEGRKAQRGVVMRSPQSLRRRLYWPEALYHMFHHCNHTLTTETPSCFPIDRRVRAQTEVVRMAFRLLREQKCGV
jgi:murein peptide amidase A